MHACWGIAHLRVDDDTYFADVMPKVRMQVHVASDVLRHLRERLRHSANTQDYKAFSTFMTLAVSGTRSVRPQSQPYVKPCRWQPSAKELDQRLTQ